MKGSIALRTRIATHPRIIAAVAMVLAASLLVLVGPLTNKVQAQTEPPPTLSGEQLHAHDDGDLPGPTVGSINIFDRACNPTDVTGTFHFTASGDAFGPYPGTFTETGTVEVGPPPDPFSGNAIRSLTTNFEIDSPVGHVTGTKRFVPGSSTGSGTCHDMSTAAFIENVQVEATIETPDGRTCTTGTADLQVFENVLGPLGVSKGSHTWFDGGFDTLTCGGSEEPTPQISIADATVSEDDTGTSEATFTVTLSKPSTNAVTVDYATADGTATQPEDYQQMQGTLTFEANQTTKTVTVPVSGDTADEPDESFSMRLSNPQNAEIADGEGSATIVDDDEAAPTCQDVAIKTDEDVQGSVAAECSDVDGNTLTYEIVDQPTDGTATVDGGDLKYDPEPNFNGSDSFTYKANDGTADSNVATVDVTVTALNDAPTTPGAITSDESLNNDGTFTLNWGASTDVDGDDVTYTLEKRATNDANWSEVASGLTSSSYTFGSGNAQAEGTWDFRVKAVDSPAGAESAYSTAENLVKVDKSGPNAPTLSFATTGQSFKATVSGVDWYKDSVKIDVAANGDPALADTSDGSGVDAASLQPNPFDVTQNGTSTASRTVKDNANNESAAGTLEVNVDAANPTLGDCPSAGPFILNSGGGTQSVTINASDGESGIDNADSTLNASVNTSTVGEKTVTFTAKDNVGHSDTKQCSYSVIFSFDGFRSPVDNPGTDATPVFNSAKAGQSIPVKFGLGGNQGLNITAAGYPKVTSINCDTSATVAPIEQYAASTANGGLTYDATANQYNYIWKTQSTYANQCFKLDLQLTDGTSHVAYFKFLK